ncbi:uncharacterized protein LOC141617319 [Silene latifolia]|uniref:uncharacterized protein LOC141617319 n=1 Tax=Silene latifolia TaxID=37657 RepID=UPI003D772B93
MACVSSTSFSIALNDHLHGFFHGKRDDLFLFCKGDVKPIFIIMETFKRFSSTSGLKINSEKSDFYCNGMSQYVVQRVLQDDLFLFCKGDVKPIFIIMETFKRFSSTSGLKINSEKSDFYCNGMSQYVVQRVLQGTGFKKRELPFK